MQVRGQRNGRRVAAADKQTSTNSTADAHSWQQTSTGSAAPRGHQAQAPGLRMESCLPPRAGYARVAVQILLTVRKAYAYMRNGALCLS
jgi:hypothetical protein